MKKISEKYKPVELRRIVKTLTDFLEENKLHYHLLIASPENETAFEWSAMTNEERLTDVVNTISSIHEEEGISIDEILTLVEFFCQKG